jgi:hypothetical protein
MQRFDAQDNFYWADFDRINSNKLFADKKVMEEEIIPQIWRVCAWIDRSKRVEIHKQDSKELVDYYRGDSLLKWRYQENGKVIEMPWKKFITEYWDRMPKYKDRIFNPNTADALISTPQAFNLWPGFRAQLIPKENLVDPLYMPWLNHLHQVLCAGDIDFYHYCLSWLSSICKKPWEKTGVFPMFVCDKQGSGRGIFFNFLIKYLFGEQIACNVSGIKMLTADWNSFQVGKVFIYCDELCSDKKQFAESWETMKSLITEDRFLVKTKYLNDIHMPNYANFVGSTQHYNSVKIEAGDRRYPIIENSDQMVGNRAYFNNLLELSTQEAANNLYSYLYYYDYPVDIKQIPMTPLRLQSMNRHKCVGLSFLEAVRDGEYKLTYSLHPRSNQGDKWITAQKLYKEYKLWSVKVGKRQISLTAFGLLMTNKYFADGNEKFRDAKCYDFSRAKDGVRGKLLFPEESPGAIPASGEIKYEKK